MRRHWPSLVLAAVVLVQGVRLSELRDDFAARVAGEAAAYDVMSAWQHAVDLVRGAS